MTLSGFGGGIGELEDVFEFLVFPHILENLDMNLCRDSN